MGTKPIKKKRFLRHTKPRLTMGKTSLNLLQTQNMKIKDMDSTFVKQQFRNK
jgi:hypothetical protein